VDPDTGVILSSEAVPRVLPWQECPGAVASATRSSGSTSFICGDLRGDAGKIAEETAALKHTGHRQPIVGGSPAAFSTAESARGSLQLKSGRTGKDGYDTIGECGHRPPP